MRYDCVLSCMRLETVSVTVNVSQCAFPTGEDQRKMKAPPLLSCVILMTVLLSKTPEAGTLPQLEGIDHWFDSEEERPRSRRLTDQAEMPGSSRTRNCNPDWVETIRNDIQNPDWMQTIRNDIQRLSDRIEMRGKGGNLAHRRVGVAKCHII